jgi:hypothetical protein
VCVCVCVCVYIYIYTTTFSDIKRIDKDSELNSSHNATIIWETAKRLGFFLTNAIFHKLVSFSSGTELPAQLRPIQRTNLNHWAFRSSWNNKKHFPNFTGYCIFYSLIRHYTQLWPEQLHCHYYQTAITYWYRRDAPLNLGTTAWHVRFNATPNTQPYKYHRLSYSI